VEEAELEVVVVDSSFSSVFSVGVDPELLLPAGAGEPAEAPELAVFPLTTPVLSRTNNHIPQSAFSS
jgi:hypothetical protein